MPTSSLLDRAESWAASLWEAARPRWPEREGQDPNYRTYVVHPAVRDVLRKRCPEGGVRLLDLGCGDGSFLEDPENRLLLRDGAYLGVDISPELAGAARKRHGSPETCFVVGDLSEREISEHIRAAGSAWDCALSVFMVQEMPDLDSFLHTLARVLPAGGCAIMVTVHPDFAVWLRDRGHMPVAEELDGGVADDRARWRWAGRYPIVDEPREPFYLPYFHRETEDYREAFLRAGFEIADMRGIPPAEDMIRLRERRISPFAPFATNVYWPRMAEGPSALLIVAERRRDHA